MRKNPPEIPEDEERLDFVSREISGVRALSERIRDRGRFAYALGASLGLEFVGAMLAFRGEFDPSIGRFFLCAGLASIISWAGVSTYARDKTRQRARDVLCARYSSDVSQELWLDHIRSNVSWGADLSELFLRYLPEGTAVIVPVANADAGRTVIWRADTDGIRRLARFIADDLPLGETIEIRLPGDGSVHFLRHHRLAWDVRELLRAVRTMPGRTPRDSGTP